MLFRSERNMNKPTDCVFCSEMETITHLFFDCIVAKEIWENVSKILGFSLGTSFESIARFWVANKKHAVLNTICSIILWSLWKSRNALIFDQEAPLL